MNGKDIHGHFAAGRPHVMKLFSGKLVYFTLRQRDQTTVIGLHADGFHFAKKVTGMIQINDQRSIFRFVNQLAAALSQNAKMLKIVSGTLDILPWRKLQLLCTLQKLLRNGMKKRSAHMLHTGFSLIQEFDIL